MEFIFSKKQIQTLKEGNEYVQPKEAGATTANIAKDITVAASQTPDKHFVIDTENYDGNSTSNEPTFSVEADSPQQAQQKILNMQKNPDVKKVMDKGSTVEIDLDGNMQENIVRYTKKELNRILFN